MMKHVRKTERIRKGEMKERDQSKNRDREGKATNFLFGSDIFFSFGIMIELDRVGFLRYSIHIFVVTFRCKL